MVRVAKQVSADKFYLQTKLDKISAQYPISEAPNPKAVERFACQLRKGLLKRHPSVFNELKLSFVWEETARFIEHHKLSRYLDAVYQQLDMGEKNERYNY